MNITCADTSVHACSSENSRRPLVAAGLADMLLYTTQRAWKIFSVPWRPPRPKSVPQNAFAHKSVRVPAAHMDATCSVRVYPEGLGEVALI